MSALTHAMSFTRKAMGWLAGAGSLALAACSGQDSVPATQDFVARIASVQPSMRALNVAPGVDAEALLDWAQWKFPAVFPKGPQTFEVVHQGVGYSVRAYGTGNFLGVTRQGEIFGLGPFTQQQLVSYGLISVWASQVQADRCNVYAERCAPASGLDTALRGLLATQALTGDPLLGRDTPNIADPLPQLGKLLFFSQSLSVQRDTACASCHHPALGGGDGLGVSIGADALQPDLVGPGRRRADGQLLVARNANTFFNIALYDRVLFWDGRVESLLAAGANPVPGGMGTPIRTPDSAGTAADPAAGPNLPAAQARFPVPGAAEMRGAALPGLSDDQVRQHIASRLGAEAAANLSSGWLPRFRSAFNRPAGTAGELVTFDNIMRAIAEYQRSAVFTRAPWQRYVLGENLALSDAAKRGALLFYRDVGQAGAGCAQCHKGDFFTDERFHAVGFPQTGPGFAADGSDLGRQRVSGDETQRQAFRTPSLLNVEVTGPWGHAGNYDSLEQVFAHYVVPDATVQTFLSAREWCRIAPFADQPNCAATRSTVTANSNAAMAQMRARRSADPANAMPVVDPNQVPQAATGDMVEFLRALTDPCVKDRSCLARWIPRPDEAPDGHQLNAVDVRGRPL